MLGDLCGHPLAQLSGCRWKRGLGLWHMGLFGAKVPENNGAHHLSLKIALISRLLTSKSKADASWKLIASGSWPKVCREMERLARCSIAVPGTGLMLRFRSLRCKRKVVEALSVQLQAMILQSSVKGGDSRKDQQGWCKFTCNLHCTLLIQVGLKDLENSLNAMPCNRF